MINIDRGVPIPPPLIMGRQPKYPWRQMQVGDSFFVAKKKARFTSTISRMKKKSGMQFIARPEGEGTRVWRTE